MMKLFKWIFLIGAGIVFGTVNVSAQPVQNLGNEVIVKPAAGKVYMIERSEGNICFSAGDDGILVIKDPSVNLSEEVKFAIKKIKDAPFQLMDESKKEPFHFNGEEVKMINFSTDKFDRYSIVYFPQSRAVYMGNHFFAGKFPNIDLGAGVDVEKYTDTISAVLKDMSDDVRIIPGHGPISTKEDLDNYKRMLIETTALVRIKIKEGKDKQTIKQEGLSEQWLMWGNGAVSTEQWLGIIYESLTRK